MSEPLPGNGVEAGDAAVPPVGGPHGDAGTGGPAAGPGTGAHPSAAAPAQEPVDPDIDFGPQPSGRRGPVPFSPDGQVPVVAVVAVGGVIGACARYGSGLLWPARPGAFPWTTLGINTLGCAVIGVFLVLVTEAWTVHRLVRPFFGTGVLGGFTTFSTYAVDIEKLIDGGHPATGLLYLAGTAVAALGAVRAAVTLTRRAIRALTVPASGNGTEADA